MKLPTVDSATWRGLITSLQAFCGLVVAAVAMPEFRQLVLQFYPAALPIIVSGAGLASFVLNFLRANVKNY